MKNYQLFWKKIREETVLASSLDKNRDIIFGANQHKYITNPVVLDKDIIEFEKRTSIRLPDVYRSYLKYYGSGGAGPDNGIYDFFSDYLSHPAGDLALDSQLTSISGCDTEIPEHHPIHNLHGVIRVATAGNPTDYFMVVTGKELGRVFAWNYDDILCDEGLFDDWYQAWINNTLSLLKQT